MCEPGSYKGKSMFPKIDYFKFDSHNLSYGNYGGFDYSAGVAGGSITGTSADPAPVDAYDALFYSHDLAYQQSSNPVELRQADIQVVGAYSACCTVRHPTRLQGGFSGKWRSMFLEWRRKREKAIPLPLCDEPVIPARQYDAR